MERRLLEMTSRWTEETRRVEGARSKLEAAERDARFKINILEGQLQVLMKLSKITRRSISELDTRQDNLCCVGKEFFHR